MLRHCCSMRARCALVMLAFMAAAAAAPPEASELPPRYAQVGGAWNGTIVVGTHHKTGTVLLAKTFRVAAKMMGVPRAKSNRTLSSMCGELLTHGAPGVCIIEHVTYKDVQDWLLSATSQAPTTPFIHAVRDPLEMCVSAYQYHLLGAEPWLVQPLRDLNGTTLQQHYQSLSQAEGVRFECMRMALELVETALVYNATRSLTNTLTLCLEDFSHHYDSTMGRLFTFLGSGPFVESLVKAAAPFDLARAPAEDARHVSASSSKQPLRDMVMSDPRLGTLLGELRELLGYSDAGAASHHSTAPQHSLSSRGRAPTAEGLCEQLRTLCATTRVGFFQWCSYGRIPRGRIPSLAGCGEAGVHGGVNGNGGGAASSASGGHGSKAWERAQAGTQAALEAAGMVAGRILKAT